MFDDYRAAVLATYQNLQAAGKLSSHLDPLTRSGIKRASAAALDERYRNEDEKVLRDFFGSRENQTAYMLAINQCDAEKFKTLQKFLNRENNTTNSTNIELLAWLIDFQPRPYQSGRNYPKPILTPAKPEENPTVAENIQPVTLPTKQEKNNRNQKPGAFVKYWKLWLFLVTTFIMIVGLYQFANKGNSRAIGNFSPGTKMCMYWTGDHYEAISCDQRKGDTMIIAIDTFRMAHLKKINKPDTLTTFSLGKIWYIKLNGNIEFYTSMGLHPVYPERRLRPLTGYILNRYVQHK